MANQHKIAVIGAGVSGLAAAYALKDRHAVTLFEKDGRLGGHANPVTIDYDGAPIRVDTGFIVYNPPNYPNFVALLDHLGIESVKTDMSFAFSGAGVEWSSNFPGGVFAQAGNLIRPAFLAMLADIGRFNRTALADLEAGRLAGLTLGGYLRLRRLGSGFRDHYLLPMGAAIWSSSPGGVEAAPAESFIRFFANHSLLQMVQPPWRTVAGSSQAYLEALTERLSPRVVLAPGAVAVRRRADGVVVRDAKGDVHHFDQVILACHSDQALALIEDADAEEAALLGAIRYAPNRAYLHRDPDLMPSRRAAWGSWNYLYGQGPEGGCVTYWMNSLQAIDASRPLFVSLNPPKAPRAGSVFAEFDYEHPQFDTAALAAQRQFHRIQGRGGLWYAGAWLGHGFHEDGLTAGLRVARVLGGDVPWSFVDHRIAGGPLPTPEFHCAASLDEAAA